jgi:hypothetical protein
MPPTIWPDDDLKALERKGITIRFTPEEYAHLEFMAALWNAGDSARGIRRPRRWKLSSVARRLIQAQLAAFAEQIGGWPGGDAEQQSFIKKAVAGIRNHARTK